MSVTPSLEEQIARIIEPDIWRSRDRMLAAASDPARQAEKVAPSLAKARAILALAPDLRSQRDALATALEEILDEVEATEEHGGGAHDDLCTLCVAMENARSALADLKSGQNGEVER